MPIRIAVIGSGPSGFYTADALLKSDADVEIDIIDKLPTPFGLIRAGVAPDHQSTKRVARSYERTAQDDRVHYFGNVEIGGDVTIDELRDCYDAVVVAIGMPGDPPLSIPGGDKEGVIGATKFVGWYNGHPDFANFTPNLNTKNVAVIGNGNVAIDVARVLVKTTAEMAATDLPGPIGEQIQSAPITDVYMFGRRGPVEAKFTNVELREMGQLENAVAILDPDILPDEVTGDWSDRDKRLRERNLKTLREFPDIDPGDKNKKVHFVFYAQPVEILGGDTVTGIRLEKTTVVDGRARGSGEFFEIECGLVIPAIGYALQPFDGLPVDEKTGCVTNDDGRIDEGFYAVGWAKRGPTGVIGTNKPDGKIAAAQILEDISEGVKPGGEALKALLTKKNVRWSDFDDWQTINEAEISNARPDAPREKFLSMNDMLVVVGKA
ncbi:MAG: FAD-dependent oxidoreductase [Alphaproteobacteria bacterium]|nr:FAD-dependent oxidoreductase [Alphaproteobacteria bacterium]